jgi:hypothetical protein
MVKLVEKNVAELLMVAMLIVVLLSSCGSTRACGPGANAWSAGNNCPAYR